MTYFSFTFINVILPIFLVIAAGAVMNTAFHIDIKSLTKLQFYILMPSMLFLKVYESQLSSQVIKAATTVTLTAIISIVAMSMIIARFRGYSKSESSVFVNSSTFFNSGNYSLPLIQLLFNDPVAVSIQAIILMAHNVAFFTIGIFTASSGNRSPKEALINVLKMPLLYIMAFAAIMKSSGVIIPDPILDPLKILTDGYMAIALLTLGAQLSETKFTISNSRLYLSSFIRLIVSPAIAFLIVTLLGIDGLLARVLVIGLGAPTAVNVVLTSIELDNEPEFASQAVFTSTILSMITINLVIMAAFTLIPA
jgi:hypothetical protein